MDKLTDTAARYLESVKNASPLIHAIINYVSMGWVADVLSALGASPLMADAENEVDEAAASADAVVLNLGTLNSRRLRRIIKAGEKAMDAGVPTVLDPVGAGALSARVDAAINILNHIKVAVIRANPSEMLALSGQFIGAKGVDTVHSVDAARMAAHDVARQYRLAAVVTGAEDLITDGRRAFKVINGHPLMGRISGTGCALGAIIAAFATVGSDPLMAATYATACFNCAGEMAAEKVSAPGSFKIAFVDALDRITPAELRQRAIITDDINPQTIG